jgi:acyl-CoA thioester hydrolase
MNALAPSTGMMDGRRHLFPIRVYYEDTDAGGIVYHASYFRFAERARTELLRALGIELNAALATHGVFFVVHSGDMRFRRPAKLDDVMTVETVLCDLGVASLNARQTIRRGEEEIFSCNLKLAAVNDTGRSAPMPDALRSKLAALAE